MKIIMETVFGSHLYGLNTPTSDKDYKGIFLPHPRDILLGKAQEPSTRARAIRTLKTPLMT